MTETREKLRGGERLVTERAIDNSPLMGREEQIITEIEQISYRDGFNAELKLLDALEAEQAKSERLIEALEFYAKGSQSIGFDRGDAAQEALKAVRD